MRVRQHISAWICSRLIKSRIEIRSNHFSYQLMKGSLRSGWGFKKCSATMELGKEEVEFVLMSLSDLLKH